jgi:hypothetical protein
VGREAGGRGAEARRGEAQPAASAARAAPGAVAGPRDVAGAGGDPLAPLDARLSILAAITRVVAQGGVSGRSLFGAERPRAPRRRGRRADRARARDARARGALREGGQPGGPTTRERVEQPVSCPCAPHADGGAAWARLRSPELQEAPAGAAGRRSAQLGSVVRRVATWHRRWRAERFPAARREPGRGSNDVARVPRLASRGRRHRARRATARQASPGGS